ncbi:MAG TPA: glycosyltransferase family A protein [Candidatus Binatia bacterium]|nr:glycosyltransferase family A protein [Candidatus Binatia bacterium]
MSAEVSIVVRCRDEARHLSPVLDAVAAQEGAPPFEVLALDSGSRDGTLDLLARHGVRVEHLAPADFSYGRALNAGAARARGEIVVYLSAHCRPQGLRWLAALLAPFAEPQVVATFGRQVPVPGMNPIEGLTTARLFPPAPPAGVLFSNANGAARRAAVLARPFDGEIPAAEDHLWACGVRPPERIVYVPDAVVGHSHPMLGRDWQMRFYNNGLATAYARRRGIAMPWDAVHARGAAGGARALGRLVGALARRGELRALAHLPAYARARAWYARGLADGAHRFGGAGA